jgi:hypothetical protein
VLWNQQLPIAYCVHDFHPRDGTARRPKGVDTVHGTHEPFYCAMVLLDTIIEIFTVPNDDRGLVRLAVTLDSRRVTAALIDGDFFWEPLGANGFAQERLGCVAIARGG